MTKHTSRDRVWKAALEIREEDDEREWRSGKRRFTPSDVRERIDDPPSDKTIRDVLMTMTDMGFLKRPGMLASGKYQTAE